MRRQLLVFLLLPAAALAQVTLEGDVARKTTGEPLPGVRVAATCGQTFWAATDATGHFRFTGLPAASCGLLFDGLGLLPRRQLVTIHPQDTHIAVRVALTPQAAIAGTVLDENGWPVARATVLAAQYLTVDGVSELQPVRRVQSDDLGRYRIGKLPPGRYYIRVRPMGGAPWGDYLPAWYPSAAQTAGARAIDLREGQEASGADIHLAPGGGVEVSGRVILPAEYQPAQAYLTISFDELGLTSTGDPVPVAADGTFMLRHVAPGKYRLMATIGNLTDDSAPPRYSALRTLEVSGDNIDGITLNVAQTVLRDLKGTIVSEGAVKPDRVHIALQRRLSNFRLTAKVQSDGSFVIPGAWPGQYRGRVSVEDGQVASLRFGGQEIFGREFDFDGTEAPLRLTVLEEGALGPISGTVTDANNRPVAAASVIIVPSDATYVPSPPGIRPPASTDQNGAFTAWPLPPGLYRIYVVEDPAETEQAMGDPDFLKSQEQAFPPLKVVAGENAPLKLVLPAK
jgi:protocatechuate 3,4-dioxygenase beta subunit